MAAFQPQAFGKYFLVDKLAMGGMAEIFLARSQSKGDSGAYLVIKRILPHFSGNAQFIDMFIDEAKISSLLSHTNIVPLYDLGRVGDSYFLAMEYVPGQDLKGLVKRCADRGVRLSYEHAAYVMREVCLGLDYAHTKHDGGGRPLAIVHRDISPQNVLVGYDGLVKITDFGIAKASSKLDSTQVGTLKGKFGYMAPEQVVAGMDLDHRSDVFAAGVILWELITGQRLFAGTNEIEILERVRAARIEAPSSLDPDIPRELERIIFKALMKDRDKRFQWAKDMAGELTKFLAQVSPRFSAADMSAVMRELFAPEIENIRAKWNVVIGAVIDKGHAERGAALESTRPDHREEPERPAKKPASSTPPPRPIAYSQEESARTQVAASPVPPVARAADKTRMSPSGRFELPPIEAPPPPAKAPRPPAPADRTSALDLLAEVDAEAFEKGIRRESSARGTPRAGPDDQRAEERRIAPPPPPPPPAPSSSTDDDFEDFADTRKNRPTPPPPPRAAARQGPSTGLRIFSWFGFLATAAAVAVGSLLYTGAIANPFAAPVIEVVTAIDTAAISIDGNVVLASGRSGRWPVGTGKRTVEVRAQGYKPFTATVDAAKGQVATVDVLLEPADDATADVEIRSTPPGVTVWIGDELAGTAPLTLHPKLGDHTLRFIRPRYDELAMPVQFSRPGPSQPIDVSLVPNVASVVVTTNPPGAVASVGGVGRGPTPVTVDGLKPGEAVEVQVVLKGHRTETRSVTPPGGDVAFPVEIELAVSEDLKARPPSPLPSPSPPAAPKEMPKAIPAGMGLLSVEVIGGWGQVYVDGVRLADRTPLEGAPLAAGEHSLRVVNPTTGSERTKTVLITAGKETRQRLALE